MDKKSIFNEYNKLFPAPAPKNPASYDEVKGILNRTPHKMLTFQKQPGDAPAYATRSSNFGSTGIYNIYVNPDYEKSYDDLLLHEVGHIIFGHLQSNAFNEKTFEMKLKFAWARIRKLIITGDDVKLSEKEIQDIYINKVKHIMLNYAMDYEVNSKIFTPDEWKEFTQKFESDWMRVQYEDDDVPEEDYEEALNLKKNDPTKKLVSALWPEDVGFPLKLQFTQYVDLMLRDPEKFFEKLLLINPPPMSGRGTGAQNDDSQGQSNGNFKKNKNSQSGQGNGDGQSDSEDAKPDEQFGGNGNGKEDKSYKGKDGKGSASGKMSLADIDRLAKEAEDMDEEAMKKVTEAAEKADQGDGDEGDDFDSSGGDDDNNGYSPFGTGLKRSEIIDIKDTHALENELLKAVYNKTVLNTRQDPVYYYNRKKYNSNVMISRSREEQLWRPGNIILLVDCSGSIDDTAIGTMVKTVRRIAKKCGPKSRIIWWDTFLEGDYPLNADKGPKGYGGTNIAKGIKYVRQHYLRQSNDKLVIISDYADSLTQWYDEVRKIKNDVVGLCWLYSRDKTETAKQYLSNWWSYDNDREENKSFDKLLKKIPTTLVNIASA